MMERRNTIVLISAALLGVGLAVVPQGFGLAQSDPFAGTWQLNLEKSKYSPGPPPRNAVATVQGEGEDRKATVSGFDAAGNSYTQVYMFIHDSRPHPVTGNPRGDAAVYTPIDDHTVGWTVTKGGQVVLSGTDTVSRDGRTFTITTTGLDANGRPINNIAVFDKQ
jgi:hypothetical protein